MSGAASAIVLGPAASGQRIRDYLELTKPRLTTLVLVTTAAGFWLGRRSPDPLALFAPTLIGTALVAGGANAINQWSERAFDALMQRTRHRPLPAGRLQPQEALRFGLGLLLGGVVLLAALVNGLSAALAAISAASYLFL